MPDGEQAAPGVVGNGRLTALAGAALLGSVTEGSNPSAPAGFLNTNQPVPPENGAPSSTS